MGEYPPRGVFHEFVEQFDVWERCGWRHVEENGFCVTGTERGDDPGGDTSGVVGVICYNIVTRKFLLMVDIQCRDVLSLGWWYDVTQWDIDVYELGQFIFIYDLVGFSIILTTLRSRGKYIVQIFNYIFYFLENKK